MNAGDRIHTTGITTVVVSVAVYVVMCIDAGVRVIMNMRLGADMFAIPLVGFLLGLVVAAVGWYVGEHQRQKGTPYGNRDRRRR